MNKLTYTILSFTFISVIGLYGQISIDIAESTLKVAALSDEVFYYGFAKGDQLIFNFEEVNGKELKELEIIELPSSSKFMDYKTKKISNKTLNISNTGIYKFRFSNSALGGRICKFKIQRIPINDATKNFNSSVFWRTVYDTTYTPTIERYLVKSDTTINNITHQIAKVHSSTNSEGNKTTFNFILPENTIVWSYYIGVDQMGQKVFTDATQKIAQSAGPIIAKYPGYGPLAALALNSISYLMSLQSGENVKYWFVDVPNVNLFKSGLEFHYIKNGNVINDFSRMTAPLTGQYFLCLYNDNDFQAIDVTVEITAIQVNQQWNKRIVQQMNISSRQEPYLKN